MPRFSESVTFVGDRLVVIELRSGHTSERHPNDIGPERLAILRDLTHGYQWQTHRQPYAWRHDPDGAWHDDMVMTHWRGAMPERVEDALLREDGRSLR